MSSFIFIFSLTFIPNNLPIRVNKMSTWLVYDLKNSKNLKSVIPKGTRLAYFPVFKGDSSKQRLLFNIYEASSPFFSGRRLEVVTIVEQIKRPIKTHFVVLECLSDTLLWDPISEIQMPNCRATFSTRKRRHSLNINTSKRKLSIKGKMSTSRLLDKQFAVDSNYLCFFQNSTKGVSLVFDENEIMKPVTMLTKSKIDNNLWQINRGSLTHCFVHEHPMNFLSTVEDYIV